MEVNYIAIELKTNDQGGTGVDVLYSGKDRRVAEQKYHTALAGAAVSGRPMHAAVLMQSDVLEGLTPTMAEPFYNLTNAAIHLRDA